jgi:hypothetical protein
MIDMTNDSHSFRTNEQLEADGWKLKGNVFLKEANEYLPLYEAKMLWHYNHRFGDYQDQVEDSTSSHLPEISALRMLGLNHQALEW